MLSITGVADIKQKKTPVDDHRSFYLILFKRNPKGYYIFSNLIVFTAFDSVILTKYVPVA
jgi:hypothetical protein